MSRFELFYSNHHPFSQWYPCPFYAQPLKLHIKSAPVPVTAPFQQGASFLPHITEMQFQNTEQWMMYHKALLFEDHRIAEQIMNPRNAKNPATIKALGRQVTGFNGIQWDQHKEQIVFQGNLAKFSQHPELAKQLLATGDKILVEASPYDRVWGIGLAQEDPRCQDPAQWRGLNLLGKALMAVRQRLQSRS